MHGTFSALSGKPQASTYMYSVLVSYRYLGSPAMRSLPTGLTGSERIISASFKSGSNGLEIGTLPNG